jgi:hypothetical protein
VHESAERSRLNEPVEKPWALNEMVEKRAEVDHRESRYDEMLLEEGRRREEGRPHALAPRPENLEK